MHLASASQPRSVDGRFDVRPLAEADIDLAAPALSLSDLDLDEVVDLANVPPTVHDDPLGDVSDLMAEYEHGAATHLGELADDADEFRSEAEAWAAANDPEHVEAFTAFALTELAAAGYSRERVADPARLHDAFRLERARATALDVLGETLPPDLSQALLAGMDRSMFGVGEAGALRRSQANAAIVRLRDAGVRVDEHIAPGRGTVWQVTA